MLLMNKKVEERLFGGNVFDPPLLCAFPEDISDFFLIEPDTCKIGVIEEEKLMAVMFAVVNMKQVFFV